MAAWIPALQAILPYVAQVVAVALPVFTRRTGRDRDEDLVGRQIQELQAAVTQNAQSLNVLAEQLRQTIATLDAGALRLDRQLRALRRLCVAALLLSVVAMAAAAAAWVR